MAIRNRTSTLPDPEYIAALEADREELWRIIDAMRLDISNLNRGRA